MADYGALDKLLHRLALQLRPVAEMSFDLDQELVKSDPKAIVEEPHVFVSGLARAGTTVLMRRFHASGAFRSLTYRDMPFVLAPNRWRKLSGASRREIEKGTRAHGDGLDVDADSPEALDEVFWRIFHGADYIRKDCLAPHAPDAEDRERFLRYVNAILAAQDADPGVTRYLSKNNNNILRLGTLRKIFPNALILVPFRAPEAHASSLMRQHAQFCGMQAEDPFVLRYMTWLAHHEFGLNQRPFRFGDTPPAYQVRAETSSLDYWLALWCGTYEALERTAPDDAIFVCYEDLCADPTVWERLAGRADIIIDETAADPLRASTRTAVSATDPALAARGAALYDRLRGRALASLT